MQKKAQQTNQLLESIIGENDQIEPQLKKAMLYSLLAGGKRIRAAVTLWSCELIAGRANTDAQTAAAAIEMVHTYSLIHDDLPAMDDDDLRRGQPTCHKAFDEATAILAGDALLTLAFEIIAQRVKDPAVALKIISRLAQAAGPAGMIAGQIADLKAEKITPNEQTLNYIHINKTAKMFQCAAAIGAITANAEEKQLNTLSEFGMKIGLGFQVADDILDESSSTDHLGKTAGKDKAAGKMTYPALFGMEKSKELSKELADQAIESLRPFGKKADTLILLAAALVERTR